MAFETSSPNMLLPIPGVGLTSGPLYATDVNNCLTLVDSHDHTTGKGVQLTPAALNINAALPLNNNNLITARSVRFQVQSAALALAADIGCLYVTGVDLYYNDISGNQVRLTQSGAVAGTPGSIANLVSPASATYVSGSQTFVWQSAANTPANMDGGSFIFRNVTASSKGATVSAPAALAADYSLVLPTLPAAQSFMTLDASGNMAAPWTVDASTVRIVANQLVSGPAGSIIMYGGAAAPTGYLLCDGSAVSRSTYSALYSAIGDAYGVGNGTTTFNVPDFRGIFPRGVTGASANDPDAASRTAVNGGNSGNNVGSKQTGAFASHTHNSPWITGGSGGSAGIFSTAVGSGGSTNYLGIADTATGGNETRPINIYVNFIIKT